MIPIPIDKEEILDAGYKVLEEGTILGKLGKPLKPRMNNKGYPKVQLYLKDRSVVFFVSRLVATFHIDNPENKPYVSYRSKDVSNCSASNLRWCSVRETQGNGLPVKDSTSRFKGVSFCNTYKKWAASIHKNGKTKFIGRFDKEEDAAIAYDKKALEYFGEFARLNFPAAGKEN